MNLSLRAATLLLPLLLHDVQSAADEQISGRHLRRNNKNKSSSSSLGLEKSDETMSISGNEEDLRRRLMEDHDAMMFQPLSCNANLSVDTCLGPDAVPFSTIVAASDHTPVSAIVQGVAMVATQSSTCWDRPASDAINGDHGDFSHTCEDSDSPAWWMVDFGDDNTAVGEVRIVNRQSGWKYRMVGADVEVLDADMSIVASKVVVDEQDIYYFNFDGAIGRHLRIIQHSKFNQAYEPLNIAEVKVRKAPVLATGQTPYEHRYIKPGSNLTSEYVTGEAHIPCGVCAIVDYTNGDTVEIPRGINVEGMLYFPPTANVELRTPHLYVQGNLKIDAPNDDEGNKIKVHMIDTGFEQFMIPHVENAGQCSAVGCSFGKKAVGIAGGTLDIQALPDPSCPTWTFLEAVLDEEEGTNQVLQVGSEAAECWGRRLGSEILITDTIGWKSYASLIGTIASVNIDAGTVTLSSPPTTHTESNEFDDFNGQAPAGWISTLANDPDYPAEVAFLSRSVTFDADTTQGNAGGRSSHCNVKQRRIGGHMMISHTSAVQRIEGVEFKNFGQSGTLGRYPIHFHLCQDVSGSIVRKNLVRSSHQRCVVIHRSNNVTVEENVAFGHKGHCFMTEDGVETGNVFRKNLGADGQRLSCVEGILGNKGENQASTYWISNPKNQFIDNVAAGSINGFWIDGGNDPIGMFSGNIAHSNLNEGIKLYQGHYRPNAPSLFVNSKSFRNYRQGVRLHLNKNIVFKGLLLADNGIAVSSFDETSEIVLEDVTVIGLTAKAREFSVSLNPPISSGLGKETGICRFCHHSISGVKFASDPSHTQLSLKSVSFHGFEPHFDGATEYNILALRLWGAFPGMHGAGGTILHGDDKRFWNMPSLEGVTINSTDNGFDFRRQLLTDQPAKMHGYFQDVNGTFHVDGPGVFIPQDSSEVVPNAPEFSFLADHRCNKANSRPDSLALFCAGSCIRKVFVHSNCPGDLLVTSTSTNEQSTFPPTRFRTLSAGWGWGHATDVWSTKLHVAFLPNDDYQLSCKNESGEIVNPKFMKVTFDGRTYQILNNNNCCEGGWYNMNFARPPPLCSPYVDQGSFQLPEVPLYQHYEANEFLEPSNVVAEVDGIKLKMAKFGVARYGPVNFGAPGESRAVLLNWKCLSEFVRVEMRLDDGTLIGSVGSYDVGTYIGEINIPPEVSGIHEVIFSAHRHAGTHYFAKIFSFEILPPLPTSSPSMSSAPTSSLVPTGTPQPTYELACGSGAGACTGRRQSAEINELHPLRCCADSDLGEAWERKYPNMCPAGVFGASKFGDTCHEAVTFSEGKSICESEGGRLCTIREVLSNCAGWTGCGFDGEMVWTATDTESVMGTVFTPDDNSKWFPFGSTLEDTGELAFSVKATNDAHVALGSAEVHPTSRDVPNHVEIFIGGWGNTRSGIRPATGDVDNQIETSGAYLSGSDYNTFRITWTPTEIKLEHLAVCGWVPMATMDRSSLGIIIDRAIVMTGWGSNGEFKLFQGLPSSCECADDASCAAAGGITNPCEEILCNLEIGLCGSPTPIQGCENGARLDRWLDIVGTNVEDLTQIPGYPDSPDETQFLGASLETPSNIGDGFGNRLQTFIMPPVTCDWNFYIASDDNSKLYLSSNDDPANKDLVASVDDWTHSKQWKKMASQKGTVSLVKGELYYLEAIHKEGGGGDNLAVGWECLEHGIALQVISAEFTTASFLPTASPTISPTTQCADDSSCAGGVTNPCEERLCNLETGLCGDFTPIQGCENGARLDRWLDIGGSNVEDLTQIPGYPDSPDETQFLVASLETPSNIGDGFGNRLQTFIMPPVTCDWNFYIASDDRSKLYLSSNDDPANKDLVASVDGWTNSKQWKKMTSQKGTVSLVKGELYYLEAIHKEGGGGDNLAVGWECLEHGIALQVISAEYTAVSIGADVSLQ